MKIPWIIETTMIMNHLILKTRIKISFQRKKNYTLIIKKIFLRITKFQKIYLMKMDKIVQKLLMMMYREKDIIFRMKIIILKLNLFIHRINVKKII